MASWRIVVGPGIKATVNSAIGAATAASVTDIDQPAVNLTAITGFNAHFAAAITAAQAALAALTGPATKCTVVMRGYVDTNTAAPHPYATASRIAIEAAEAWGS